MYTFATQVERLHNRTECSSLTVPVRTNQRLLFSSPVFFCKIACADALKIFKYRTHNVPHYSAKTDACPHLRSARTATKPHRKESLCRKKHTFDDGSFFSLHFPAGHCATRRASGVSTFVGRTHSRPLQTNMNCRNARFLLCAQNVSLKISSKIQSRKPIRAVFNKQNEHKRYWFTSTQSSSSGSEHPSHWVTYSASPPTQLVLLATSCLRQKLPFVVDMLTQGKSRRSTASTSREHHHRQNRASTTCTLSTRRDAVSKRDNRVSYRYCVGLRKSIQMWKYRNTFLSAMRRRGGDGCLSVVPLTWCDICV